MKTLARTMMSLVATAALFTAAQAQTKTATPATPAPAAKAPVAPVAAKPNPSTPAAPAAPAAPMEMPKAPVEVSDMAKTAGNWRCSGMGFSPAGEMKMVATIKNKLDLDKWWIRTTFTETTGSKFKFEAFTTFDPATKTWKRILVDNFGSHEVDTSTGPKDGKLVWEGTSTSAMGTMPGRHYEEAMGKDLKMWGEYSMDKGKTYMKAYDVICKR